MGALSSLASIGLNLALAQQASKEQSRSIRSERDRQIAAIRERDEQQRREQETALRRRLATQRARAGEIDPVLGRDEEIRQVIDILTRRRQNNPILTGEAGVGKTAVVEALAERIGPPSPAPASISPTKRLISSRLRPACWATPMKPSLPTTSLP